MSRRFRVLLPTLALLGLFALPSVAQSQTTPVLRASVGNPSNADAFEIRMTREDGSPLGALDPGTYTIVVNDYSTMHNFHLFGPGVSLATRVEEIETVTWTVTLTNGRYDFVCDPHATLMRGNFRIGPPPPAPARLNASVGPGSSISLKTAGGARVRALPAGRYRIVVSDRSRAHNFRLVGPGVTRATGVKFRGTVTWTITLRAGTYRFMSVPQARRLKGSFRVT